MKCIKCGGEILPGQAFCTTCGTPVQQQVNNVQGEKVNQNLGGQGAYTPPPKKKGAPVIAIILILILVAVIIVGAIFMVKIIVDNSDSSTSTSSSRKKNNTSDDDDVIDNSIGNKVTNNTVSGNGGNEGSSKNNVVFNGFSIKVPNNLVYEISGDTISITDKADTFLINMQLKDIPFSSISAQKDAFADKMREMGVTVSKVEEKMINGNQCLIYEITESESNSIMALVRVNTKYTALCQVVDADYTTYNYKRLEDAVSIAITAEETSSSASATTSSEGAIQTNIKTNSSINYDEIFKVQ